MIQGFADARTERLSTGAPCPAQWRSVKSVALRKLDILDVAGGFARAAGQPARGPQGGQRNADRIAWKLWIIIKGDKRWAVCGRIQGKC